MRSLNTIKNTIIAFIMNFLNVLAVFISQRVFINILGEEYLGINGIFTDIISFLSIAELGLGTAIIYSMYAPLSENNTEKLNSLMDFYKKTYRVIALIIFILGLAVVPFIHIIIGETSVSTNIYLIYSLFLIEAVSSYFISYKRSILYANQQAYIINLIHIGYIVFCNAFQIIALLLTKNYILYLLLRILFKTLENIVATVIANKLYPFIKEKNIQKLDKQKQNDIIKKVKGLLFHRIGNAGINASDNIVISIFFGVGNAGLYTNYTTILTGINVFFTHIFYAITSSVGNLLLNESKEKVYQIYKSLYLFTFWIYSFASIGLVCLGEQFITIWVGEQYLLGFWMLVLLGVKFFTTGMKNVFMLFKDAAGIFYEDRFIPLIETIVNIVASVILLKTFGLPGVVMGTIISTLVPFSSSYPKLVYKKLFDKDYKSFIFEQISHLILFIFTYASCILIVQNVVIENFYLSVLFRLSVAVLIPNLLYLLIFFKTEAFKYYFTVLKFLKNRKNNSNI